MVISAKKDAVVNLEMHVCICGMSRGTVDAELILRRIRPFQEYCRPKKIDKLIAVRLLDLSR